MVNDLLTTRDVAAHLGLSPETILRRFRAGELPGYRLASNVLRFRADDVDAYLEARRDLGRDTTEEGVSNEMNERRATGGATQPENAGDPVP